MDVVRIAILFYWEFEIWESVDLLFDIPPAQPSEICLVPAFSERSAYQLKSFNQACFASCSH